LLIGTSISIMHDPIGTAGMARYCVNGFFCSPPARMTARVVEPMFI